MNLHMDETRRLGEGEDIRDTGRERRASRYSSSIAGGVFLIGLGMLALTGWWWPGIMLVIGAAGAAELMRQGQTGAALSTFAGCAAIPLGVAVVQAIEVPWLPVGAFVLIALGLLSLVRATGRAEGGRP